MAAILSINLQTVVGLILMLETCPSVSECAIVTHGHACPQKPGRRIFYVDSTSTVRDSAARFKNRSTLLSDTVAIVHRSVADRARRTVTETPQINSIDTLRHTNHQLELLHATRGAEPDDQDREIAELERRVAEMIRSRSDQQLEPMERDYECALRRAKAFLDQ